MRSLKGAKSLQQFRFVELFTHILMNYWDESDMRDINHWKPDQNIEWIQSKVLVPFVREPDDIFISYTTTALSEQIAQATVDNHLKLITE